MGSYLLPLKGPGAAPRKAMMTVAQLAEALGAAIFRPGPEAGDAAQQAQLELDYALQRLRPIEHVTSFTQADKAALVFVEEQATLAAALACGAGAILLPSSLASHLPTPASAAGPALLTVKHPRFEFARAARMLRPDDPPTRSHPSAYISVGSSLGSHVGVGPSAVVEKGAVIGDNTTIGAGAVIGGGVVIGANCRIYPRVVIYPGTKLGDRGIVHAGAVLGSDGFGYVKDEATGAYLKFPQQGTLVIEDDVEIGANTTIDRGALEETRIARGVKIDNLVHIGHNVQVGANAVIAAQVGVSGSSSIGAGAVLAGQVGIGDHAAVGDGVILGGQGGVLPHKTLTGAGQLFWGTPAKPVKEYLRELASLTRLARRKSASETGDAGTEGK